MAKLRKFTAYRTKERPYTRFSKFKNKSYVRTKPACHVVRFDQGNLTKIFPVYLTLESKEGFYQIRDNAIEAARQSCNRYLEKHLGTNYSMKVRLYPHHMIRENPLASGAGADRMSTGMAHSFGKVIGIGAQIPRAGNAIITVGVERADLPVARLALKRASYKIPFGYRMVETKAFETKASQAKAQIEKKAVEVAKKAK